MLAHNVGVRKGRQERQVGEQASPTPGRTPATWPPAGRPPPIANTSANPDVYWRAIESRSAAAAIASLQGYGRGRPHVVLRCMAEAARVGERDGAEGKLGVFDVELFQHIGDRGLGMSG